ncbi:MAG TPA: transcription termination factor Rho, partial [Myxococcales bacterium]|nr:transcription termination factor Rho [Myxococcales bacterium]
MNLNDIKHMKMAELVELANELGVEDPAAMIRHDLIFALLQAQTEREGAIHAEGVLQVLPDGYGFLRSPDYNYFPGSDDIYVSPSQVRRFGLRNGDTVAGEIRPPREGERYFALLKVDQINFEEPERARNKILFDNLTPLYPNERLKLEYEG